MDRIRNPACVVALVPFALGLQDLGVADGRVEVSRQDPQRAADECDEFFRDFLAVVLADLLGSRIHGLTRVYVKIPQILIWSLTNPK